MNRPKILFKKLPGPKARSFVMRDKKVISPSYTRSYPAVIESGKGVWLFDVDGNSFLDFNAGVAVCSTGHCHPKVIEAVITQAKKLIHYSGTDFYYPVEIEFAERLTAISPTGKDSKVFFGNSGTEAIEGALKLARHSTGRQNFVAFFYGFHGRTMGSLSLTASKIKQRKHFAPFMPGVVHVPYADCYRCVFNRTYEKCDYECIKYIEETVFKTVLPPDEVAGIVFEPIQGEGGYVVPPDEFIVRLRKIADKYGILLIADEVQSGMGRTGKMFAIEHTGVRPDILVLAKGIASGLPLGAFISKGKIMDWEPGQHGNTFGGNPLACAAAIATLNLLKDGLIKNAERVGKFLLNNLLKLKEESDIIGDVRGRGLMIGVEIVKNKKTKERGENLRDEIVQRCFDKGVLFLGAGPSSIRFSPPLIITKEEAEIGFDIFNRVVREVEKKGIFRK